MLAGILSFITGVEYVKADDVVFKKDIPSKMDILNRTHKYYNYLYNTLIVEKKDALIVESHLRRNVIHNRELMKYYFGLTDRSGVPTDVIIAIHFMEGKNNINRNLLNGAREDIFIEGNIQKTANMLKKTRDRLKDFNSNWNIATKLNFLELWNGMGYSYRGINSPYLWGNTNHHTRGKFVSDGVYRSKATTNQIGAVVVLNSLL